LSGLWEFSITYLHEDACWKSETADSGPAQREKYASWIQLLISPLDPPENPLDAELPTA